MGKNKSADEFIQGFACAVATFAYFEGGSSGQIEEALGTIGVKSVADLRKHKVDEYDIEALRPAIKSMQSSERYRQRSIKRCKAKLEKEKK